LFIVDFLESNSRDYQGVPLPRMTEGRTDQMDAAALQATLETLAADYTKRLGLRVETISAGELTLSLPVRPDLVHGGGVLCGQAILAAADTAMLLAMIADIGEFRPMTTVQLQTSFIRPIPGDAASVTVVARMLRRGKSLSFGEVEFRTPDGKVAAHATTTYALLESTGSGSEASRDLSASGKGTDLSRR
jgi:uncharacterized protein (TIGR00369 family)